MNNRKLTSTLLLLLTAAIWGFAFVAQKTGMEYIGPFTFNFLRFSLGALCVLLFSVFTDKIHASKGNPTEHPYFIKSRPNKTLFTAGLLCGLALFSASSFQQTGLQYTSAGKCAFITALYMVIVPILSLFLKKRTAINTWAGVILAAIGFYFLCLLPGELSLGRGDVLTLIGSVFWAAQIIIIDIYANRTDGVKIAALQFLVTAVLSFFMAIFFEDINLYSISLAIIPVLYGGILSVGVAFTLQIIGQKYTPPALAALTLSMESVFAVAGGALLLHESLTGRETLGCILIFAGIILAQIPVQALMKNKRSRN